MYVADYVLMEYGTGAIMAVPGHDERDFDFATQFELPIRRVVGGGGELPYSGDGPLVNSSPEFDGLHNREALEKIVDWLDREGKGHRSINYRLRDWLLSRQRYWGAPIPIVYCDEARDRPGARRGTCPSRLPDVADYAPQGRSPLAAAEDWVNTTCPICGGPARRETDTMDTDLVSAGSAAPSLEVQELAPRLRPVGHEGRIGRSRYSVAFLRDAVLARACFSTSGGDRIDLERVQAEDLRAQRRRDLADSRACRAARARSGTCGTPGSGPAASRTRSSRCPTARCPRRST